MNLRYVDSIKAEQCAKETVQYFVHKKLWHEVYVYVNGHRYQPRDNNNIYPTSVEKSENHDPRGYFSSYTNENHFLSISFRDQLWKAMNDGENGKEIQDDLRRIFNKYGYYYVQPLNWFITLYPCNNQQKCMTNGEHYDMTLYALKTRLLDPTTHGIRLNVGMPAWLVMSIIQEKNPTSRERWKSADYIWNAFVREVRLWVQNDAKPYYGLPGLLINTTEQHIEWVLHQLGYTKMQYIQLIQKNFKMTLNDIQLKEPFMLRDHGKELFTGYKCNAREKFTPEEWVVLADREIESRRTYFDLDVIELL